MKNVEVIKDVAIKRFAMRYPDLSLDDVVDNRVFELVDKLDAAVQVMTIDKDGRWAIRLCGSPLGNMVVFGIGTSVECRFYINEDEDHEHVRIVKVYEDNFNNTNVGLISVAIRNNLISFIQVSFTNTFSDDEKDYHADFVKTFPSDIHQVSLIPDSIFFAAALLAYGFGGLYNVSYRMIGDNYGMELHIIRPGNIRMGLLLTSEVTMIDTTHDGVSDVDIAFTETCKIYSIENPDIFLEFTAKNLMDEIEGLCETFNGVYHMIVKDSVM